MLKKINRLKLSKDIEAVMKLGRAVYFSFLLLKYRKNDLPYSRFVFVVSNKVSKKATKRNLARRRAREVIRLNFEAISKGYDVAVVLSPKTIDAQGKVIAYKAVEKILLEALQKANLL